ncbi:hypothetical protein GPA10_04455 [Streptomyces sp. p1417]|uniref:Uncharacterized protein n=1 Tax=Streptomyces typhae TaxID=2681492 RepID=A0A6L6WR83_9ACTN|nr:hypothetical protein [Streptomyces typhae]MVO84038.1 hypothetical protein [Streptomyces typhae]
MKAYENETYQAPFQVAGLDPTDAALVRDSRERYNGEQGAAAAREQSPAGLTSEQKVLESLVARLHANFHVAAAALAQANELLARHHEHLANAVPASAEQHRSLAEETHRTAQRIREISHRIP